MFPLLYRVALDVLPYQASSVPCERVFSSSKETDSLHRTSLSPAFLEMLQILKFRFRNDRLDFANGWISTEAELLDLEVSPVELKDLLCAGKVDEFFGLLRALDNLNSGSVNIDTDSEM